MFENLPQETRKRLRQQAVNAILQDCASILEGSGFIGHVDAWLNTKDGDITFTKYEHEHQRIDLNAINPDLIWICGVKSEIYG